MESLWGILIFGMIPVSLSLVALLACIFGGPETKEELRNYSPPGHE